MNRRRFFGGSLAAGVGAVLGLPMKPVRTIPPRPLTSQAEPLASSFLDRGAVEDEVIDWTSSLPMMGPKANLPSGAGVAAGQIYFETEGIALYQYDGSAWIRFGDLNETTGPMEHFPRVED